MVKIRQEGPGNKASSAQARFLQCNQRVDIASSWSEAGKSRLLLTTNKLSDSYHRFFTEGYHHTIHLPGLSPDAAISFAEYFLANHLAMTDCIHDRDSLATLVKRVGYHPQAIMVVMRELKGRSAGELLRALESAHRGEPSGGETHPLWPALLVAVTSLKEEVRERLPQLGIFRGGVLESILLKVTDLRNIRGIPDMTSLQSLLRASITGDASELAGALGMSEELLTSPEISETLQKLISDDRKAQQEDIATLQRITDMRRDDWWPKMRDILQDSGLLGLIPIDHEVGTFLRFHPALSSLAASKLPQREEGVLLDQYCLQYLSLVPMLKRLSKEKPRAFQKVLRLEAPNLIAAARMALERAGNWPSHGERNHELVNDLLALLKENFDRTGDYGSAKKVAQLLAEMDSNIASTVGEMSPIYKETETYRALESGLDFLKRGDYELAERRIRCAIEKSEESGNASWRLLCHEALAFVRQKSGDINGTLIWARKAAEDARQHGDPDIIILTLLYLSFALLDIDKIDEAQQLAVEAQIIIKREELGSKWTVHLFSLLFQIAAKKALAMKESERNGK